MQILIPVQRGNLILVHVERTNGQRTMVIVTRSCQKLIFLTNRERSALNGYHSDRINISYTLLGFEISRLLVIVIPTCCVGHLRV